MEKNEYLVKNRQIILLILTIIINFNYGLIVINSFIINKWENNAYLIPIYTIFFFILIVAPLKIINTNKNELSKYLESVYSLISTILLITIMSYLFSNWFYIDTAFWWFQIGFILIISFISFFKLNTIITLGFLLMIIELFIFFIFFDSKTNHYIGNLCLINPKEISFDFSLFFYIIIIFDNYYLLSLENSNFLNSISNKNTTKNNYSFKKIFIIACFFTVLLSTLHIMDLFIIVDYRYLKVFHLPSIQTFFLHKGFRYVEHFDLVLLYISYVTVVIKGAIYLHNIIFNFFNKKESKKTTIKNNVLTFLISIILFIFCYYFNKNLELIIYLCYLLVIIILLIILSYCVRNKKDGSKKI